jgi:cytochrome c-type biogenesis protein CcmH
MERFKRLWPLVVLLVLALTSVARAQEPVDEVTDDDVNRVARELYCPICENTPLDVCETQACEDWRQLIREKLASGQGEEEIVEYFAEIYGERARATPTTRGFSLIIWIAPIVVGVIGVAVFVRLLRRWLARGAEGEATTVPASSPLPSDLAQDGSEIDDYVARLEQEVRESS